MILVAIDLILEWLPIICRWYLVNKNYLKWIKIRGNKISQFLRFFGKSAKLNPREERKNGVGRLESTAKINYPFKVVDQPWWWKTAL